MFQPSAHVVLQKRRQSSLQKIMYWRLATLLKTLREKAWAITHRTTGAMDGGAGRR